MVGGQYPADPRLHFLHSYNIGRQGHIKLSRVCSACYMVTASLHTCSSWNRGYVTRACSETVQGSAVTDVTFLSLGGDSLDSAKLLVWGLWLWCLLPYFPSLIASWDLFCLFSHWLTGTLVYWFGVQLKSSAELFFLCGTFSYYCG